MNMQLYNSLSKQKEHIKPLDEAIRMYSCGPTVYDHIHIGNLRAFIVADTLRRVLGARYNVRHVMNFTDIDDKTIRRSQELYSDESRHEALAKLTHRYETVFLSDMQQVGCETEAIEFIRATESIAQMQELITRLFNSGFAYIADDGVYFSIDEYKNAGKTYGQLSNIDSDTTSQSRISNDEYDKDAAQDFALWKLAKPNEPSWDFELNGKNLLGRPGWHIECSAMSASALGQPFDIHTGGVDLVFPHHENEIAQSTAANTNPVYATTFIHNEHLLVDGKKMSKSLQNFYTLRDIEEKGYDPLAFRLNVLQSHYRSQMSFSWKSLDASMNRLQTLRSVADLKWQMKEDDSTIDFKSSWEAILDQLNDDLNTPLALAKLSTLTIDPIEEQGYIASTQASELQEFLNSIDEIFGLQLADRSDLTKTQYELLAQRQTARDNKQWQLSDELRDKLMDQNITIKDTPRGQIWSRQNS